MSSSVDQMATQSCVKNVVINLIAPYMSIVTDIHDHIGAKLLLVHIRLSQSATVILLTHNIHAPLICTLQFVSPVMQQVNLISDS